MALWSGRFTEGADAFTQRFGASLPVDQRLYVEDIAGSIAHANMLAAQGIIATADAEAIAEGLQGILADITSGALTFDVMESEDIHMAIEAELTRRHNDANMMAIGAGFTGEKLAERMVEVFLSTDFEGGRHARRVDKIMALEA